MSNRDLIVDIVKKIFFVGREYGMTDSDSFFESGVFDSFGMMELIRRLEQDFGVTVEDDEMVPENLDSVTAILAYLERKGVKE